MKKLESLRGEKFMLSKKEQLKFNAGTAILAGETKQTFREEDTWNDCTVKCDKVQVDTCCDIKSPWCV
ncbi:MAG: hypothetical protein WBA74_12135 [Cyclobacteriaceae bacterium]